VPATFPLQNNNLTVIEQLRVPNTGNFVVFGRVTVANYAGSVQQIVAMLTTLDGATQLDNVWVTVPSTGNGNVFCIALQGILVPGAPNQNEIVDIRCGALNGAALFGSLFAISVDQISGSLT
jgi:hypothetical protein